MRMRTDIHFMEMTDTQAVYLTRGLIQFKSVRTC